MTEFLPYRTGAARQTAARHAATPLRCAQMLGADIDVIAALAERPDRASGKARPGLTTFARVRPPFARRNRDRLHKPQGAAIAVPKPVLGMDQQSERRRRDRFGAHRPALERQVRRPFEREQRDGAEPRSEAADHAAEYRSSGFSAPSKDSGEPTKAGQWRFPTMPTSTRVRFRRGCLRVLRPQPATRHARRAPPPLSPPRSRRASSPADQRGSPGEAAAHRLDHHKIATHTPVADSDVERQRNRGRRSIAVEIDGLEPPS